ncbi:MAG: NAD(P)-dependent glycerol-3-phosphate dehydrogenase [Alphaproteobacteria bacterium]|nr:NAD(P)-dependent glycerol-3-phosphate dehydrogenase [Alphaproteobacteria bacterium]
MSSAEIQHIAVAGGGAWGTALALTALRAGRRVSLWAREPEIRAAIRTRGENVQFLPGVSLSGIDVVDDIAAVAAADAVLMAAPAQHVRATTLLFAPALSPGQPVILCAKGLERGTTKLMTEVLAEAAPQAAHAVLSGPSFADDVARGLPTAVTLAAGDLALAERLSAALGTAAFRPYASDDPTGAAIGGAVKNVLAIGCGIAEGKGLGLSARAAVIARGFAEMRRFAAALGAQPATLAGLSGLGDLVLTCSSAQSRNFAFGLALAKGETVPEATGHAHGVVEGAATARPVVERALALGVDMPIAEAVAALVEGRVGVDEVIAGLLSRPLRAEAE